MMKKTVVRIIVLILWILSIFLSFYVGRCYQWASTTELEMSKDYNEITVGENEIMDYSVFIDIPEKYKALEQIEEPRRVKENFFLPNKRQKIFYHVLCT